MDNTTKRHFLAAANMSRPDNDSDRDAKRPKLSPDNNRTAEALEEMKHISVFDLLPDELLLMIIQRLQPIWKQVCKSVCHLWH